jgi:hypothetical protein
MRQLLAFFEQIKLNRPFYESESEIDVQMLNRLNMGRILLSNVACSNTANHISDEMGQKVCRAIVENRHKFAILIDESTTVSKLSTLIIYIRTSFNGSEPVTLFLDLVELSSQTAPSIVTALLSCLERHGLCDDLEPDMEMTQVEFFIRFGFPDYWMDEAYYAPNPKRLCSKL